MDILDKLKMVKDDPMWADHSEITKKTLGRAIDEIERLRTQAKRHEAEISVLRDELEKAKAASVPANEFPHDEMDAIALHRFKVEQTDSNVWGWCVRAGDGTQELYKGRKSSCEAVARRLIGAFLDGAMLAHDMLAAAPQPQQADIVLDKICDVFKIGKFWHTESTILENVKNAARRSQCLSDIERKFFTTVYEDDEGDTVEDCALNWGDEPSEYVERFGEALRTLIEQQKQAASVPAMHICCNCSGRGEVGESHDGANWFSVACELCKGEGKTLRYVRRPTQDKRIGNGDDFAGDAWFDQAERKIVYGAVGVDRNAAPEAPKS